jgi:hypothetical protein
MRRKYKIFVASVVVATAAWVPAHATAGGRGDGHGHKKPPDVITGINGPVFGITSTRSGDLLAADASAGVLKFHRGRPSVKASIPGASDVSVAKDGDLWVTTGAGESPEADTGQGLWRVSHGRAKKVVNLFEFEADNNPHPEGVPDSNPFDVQALKHDSALVVDAGGNDLLRVDKKGRVKVLATFPTRLASTANIKALAGCPDAPPDFAFACGLPDQIPAQATPTSVAIGPDGYYYVGELRGFPAPTNESSIWRVAPWANAAECGVSPQCTKVFDGGFTSIIDLAFGKDGKLYVAELDEASWAAVEITQTPTGGTINACRVRSGTCREVETDIPVLTSITFAKHGSLWATRNALTPGGVEIFRVR